MTEQPFDLPLDEALLGEGIGKDHHLARIDTGVWDAVFQLFVPKDWTMETNLGERLDAPLRPVPLGLFLAPGKDGSALISVAGYRMNMEVSLEDWVNHALAQYDVIPFGGRWVNTPRGLCYDAGAVQKKPGGRYFCRVTAFAFGGIIYIVTSQCLEALWPQLKNSFLAANLSFEIMGANSEFHRNLEPWKVWTTAPGAGTGTMYPGMWLAESVPTRSGVVKAADFKLANAAGDQLVAYLRLKFESGSAAEALDQVVKKLNGTGFEITRDTLVKCTPDSYSLLFPGNEGMWVAKIIRDNEPGEIRVGMRRLASALAVVVLISPAQSQQPVLWMRAKRAFEIILNHSRFEP